MSADAEPAQVAGRPLIVAHRGVTTGGAIENTLEALSAAMNAGCEMAEIDVRRTRDGQLVIFHDVGVGGTAVAELSRAELAARAGHEPPLLAEALELARGRIGLDIELKEDGYVEQVLTALDVRRAEQELIVTSFLEAVVAQCRQRGAALLTGLIVSFDAEAGTPGPVARALRCGAHCIAPQLALTRGGPLLDDATAAGLPALVWDANDDAEIERLLADERVAAVITDRPARALELGTALGRPPAALLRS